MKRQEGSCLQPSLGCKLSYKGSRDPNSSITEQWYFMEVVEASVSKGDVNHKQTHLEGFGEVDFSWDISFEFDRRVYQYSFTLVGCDEINKKLVAMPREIDNLCEVFCGEMSISGKDFPLPTKGFRLLNVHLLKLSATPYLPLELKPSGFSCHVLVSAPPIIASPRTIVMLPRSTYGRNLTEGLTYNPSTEVTLDFFCHFLLTSFCGYYSINNPIYIGGRNNDPSFP